MKWEDRAEVGLLHIVYFDDHKVRVYENRLAIQRLDGERLTWEELQDVKQKAIGDTVEVKK